MDEVPNYKLWQVQVWPAFMQQAWRKALEPGDGLVAPGPAALFAPRTRGNAELALGRYFDFCRRRGLLANAKCVGDYLDIPCIRAFVMEELAKLAPQTRLLIMGSLDRAFRVADPTLDRSELKRAIRRFGRVAKPIREIDSRLVSPPDLITVANKLFAEAEADRVQGIKSAVSFRNGLIILLGAYHGFRRENVRTAMIGQHFKIAGDKGSFEFTREEMKGRRRYAGPLAPEFVLRANQFIEIYRPRLIKPGAPDPNYLFLSWTGEVMRGNRLSQCVGEEVLQRTGCRFAFHMFRYSAATFIADHAPERIQIAQHLLHHRRFRTTSRYYIRGQQKRAIRKYQEAVGAFINRSKRRLRRRRH